LVCTLEYAPTSNVSPFCPLEAAEDEFVISTGSFMQIADRGLSRITGCIYTVF
jgi:hypothetical protein